VALAFVAVAGTLLLSERSLERSRDLAAEGDLAGAAEAARDAARLQPGSEEPWLQLGQVQVLAGDHEAGAESFREAVERSPDSPQANLVLAVALYSIGDPEADAQQDHAVELLPADR
jgi:cytochrome c-type biogenesis protein CcmH/NrfG